MDWHAIKINQSINTVKMINWFNGRSTGLGFCCISFRELFTTKTILAEEYLWYYTTHKWRDKGVHTFPGDHCPKVNVITLQEFELVFLYKIYIS